MKGSLDLNEIVGFILFVTVVFPILLTILPIFQTFMISTSCSEQIKEIDNLNNKIKSLEYQLLESDSKISQLSSLLSSLNTSLTEKDLKISNLTSQLIDKEQKIQNLTERINELEDELNFYKEKEYIKQINNYFYNISNYLTNIENRFFPIQVSISLISITTAGVIFKVFGLDRALKNIIKRIRERKNENLKSLKENER